MAAANESRVLRFFGVEEAEVCRAASGLAGRCGLAQVESRSQGAETLLALTAPASALRKAEEMLRRSFRAGLYGAGAETLPDSAARALVRHDRLLACADRLALELLAPRLEGREGVDSVFDFGVGSCADPDAAARIEAAARRCRGSSTPDGPLWDELCRLRGALRVTRADLVAGAIPYEGGTLVLLAGRKGCWAYPAAAGENAALWLLDIIRRAAAGSPQAQGVSFALHGERPSLAARGPALQLPPPAAPDAAIERALALPPEPEPARLPRRRRWPARLAFLAGVLLLAGLAAALWATGGDLAALPALLRGLTGSQPPAHSGAALL